MPDEDVESPSLIETEPTEEHDAAAEQDLGSLTIEDNPEGTVDPAELAGTDQDA